MCELDTTGVQSKIRTTPNCRSPCSFGQICVIDSKMSSDTGDDALSPSGRSQPDECWDVCVDNWAEFCKEEKGELPKVIRSAKFHALLVVFSRTVERTTFATLCFARLPPL